MRRRRRQLQHAPETGAEPDMYSKVRSNRMHLAVVLLLLCGFIRTACAAVEETTPPQFRDVRKLIEDRLAQERIPSLAVGVAKDGKVLWTEAFGWADVAQQRAATPDTRYCLGSVSKPLTATGLMVLVSRGKLDLDHPANRYLGEAKLKAHVGDADAATLRRLADHTSGLARHDLYAADGQTPVPVEELLTRYGHLLRPPGESYEYSNLGYMTLAYIMERQSGQPYAGFMEAEVFRPLGMMHSSVGVDPQRPELAAVCYGTDGKPRHPPFGTGAVAAPGGIYASVQDLLRFGMFHLKQSNGGTRRILPDAALDMMHKPSAQTAVQSWYGIGWRIEPRSEFGYLAILHTGQTDGATACLVLIPEHRLCVVAVTNSPHPLPWQVTQEIIRRLVPPNPKPVPPPADSQRRFGRQEYRPSKEWVGRWEGRIRTHEKDIPVVMSFEEGGKVLVQLQGQVKAVAGGVRMEDGYLRGSLDGDLGTTDLAGLKYRLHFKLRLRGTDLLNGSITASSHPSQRVVTLSHGMELRRTP
jgi:CubicO group peptidase (beta-lactamase class C family)